MPKWIKYNTDIQLQYYKVPKKRTYTITNNKKSADLKYQRFSFQKAIQGHLRLL